MLLDCLDINGACDENETCQETDLKFTTVSRCECKAGYHRVNHWSKCTGRILTTNTSLKEIISWLNRIPMKIDDLFGSFTLLESYSCERVGYKNK